MAQIDVTIVIDAQSLYTNHIVGGSPDSPIQISDQYVYIVTDYANALQGTDGTAELTIVATTDDEIRWQATSATLTSSYSVQLYQFQFLSGAQILETPSLNVRTVYYYYPSSGSSPLDFIQGTAHVPAWSADVLDAGRATYNFRFALLKGSSSTPIGYYYWDPYINTSLA